MTLPTSIIIKNTSQNKLYCMQLDVYAGCEVAPSAIASL